MPILLTFLLRASLVTPMKTLTFTQFSINLFGQLGLLQLATKTQLHLPFKLKATLQCLVLKSFTLFLFIFQRIIMLKMATIFKYLLWESISEECPTINCNIWNKCKIKWSLPSINKRCKKKSSSKINNGSRYLRILKLTSLNTFKSITTKIQLHCNQVLRWTPNQK